MPRNKRQNNLRALRRLVTKFGVGLFYNGNSMTLVEVTQDTQADSIRELCNKRGIPYTHTRPDCLCDRHTIYFYP